LLQNNDHYYAQQDQHTLDAPNDGDQDAPCDGGEGEQDVNAK
jgi:hypothetical protein